MIGRFTGPGAFGGRLALPLIFTPVVFLALPVGNYVFVTLRRLITTSDLAEALSVDDRADAAAERVAQACADLEALGATATARRVPPSTPRGNVS